VSQPKNLAKRSDPTRLSSSGSASSSSGSDSDQTDSDAEEEKPSTAEAPPHCKPLEPHAVEKARAAAVTAVRATFEDAAADGVVLSTKSADAVLAATNLVRRSNHDPVFDKIANAAIVNVAGLATSIPATAAAAPRASSPELVEDSEDDDGGRSVDLAAPAAAASAASSSGRSTGSSQSAAESADASASLKELLRYIRDVSDHVVRAGPAFDPLFPGALVTEWQPEEYKYKCPFTLLWLYDEQTRLTRNDNQQLSAWQKQMPLLPVWSWGVAGDGDCAPAAIVLADYNECASEVRMEIWNAVLSLQRDPVFGLPTTFEQKKKLSKAVLDYRALYVDRLLRTHHATAYARSAVHVLIRLLLFVFVRSLLVCSATRRRSRCRRVCAPC
jgi:hypothetical protein